jgi:bacteriorhodopsin
MWWWAAAAALLSLVALQLRRELLLARKSTPALAGYAATMSCFVLMWGATLATTFLLGQEGVGAMTRALETCLLVRHSLPTLCYCNTM